MKKAILSSLTLATLLVGCSPQEESTVDHAAPTVPAVFITQAITATPTAIPAARTQFSAGEEVTVTGLVMGVPHPFVAERGAFVLGDEATLVPCDAKGDDHCSMPWDACCDPTAVRQAGTVTIQVLGNDGKLLRQGVKGIQGLKELSRVTVTGIVAPNSSAASFILNATAIHIGVR